MLTRRASLREQRAPSFLCLFRAIKRGLFFILYSLKKKNIKNSDAYGIIACANLCFWLFLLFFFHKKKTQFANGHSSNQGEINLSKKVRAPLFLVLFLLQRGFLQRCGKMGAMVEPILEFEQVETVFAKG